MTVPHHEVEFTCTSTYSFIRVSLTKARRNMVNDERLSGDALCRGNMPEMFPTINGRNLNKKRTVIPDDFSDKNIIAIIAFQRWHQDLVDESIECLEKLNMNETHHVIEVPVLQQFSKLRQMRLDGVMRAAIVDYRIRQRTITAYLDKQVFRNSLNIPSEDTTYWFLIDHVTKNILLRGTGVITSEEVNQIKLASE